MFNKNIHQYYVHSIIIIGGGGLIREGDLINFFLKRGGEAYLRGGLKRENTVLISW